MLVVMESPVKYFHSVERESCLVNGFAGWAAALRFLVITVQQKAL